MNKRSFIKKAAALGIAGMIPIDSIALWTNQFENISAVNLAEDEYFWEGIRKEYKIKPDYINLENGYYCFLPQVTLENYINHIREINYQGSYYMRTVQWENKKMMMTKLAKLAGCSDEELIITRNTTESLDMIIGGLHWKQGDNPSWPSRIMEPCKICFDWLLNVMASLTRWYLYQIIRHQTRRL